MTTGPLLLGAALLAAGLVLGLLLGRWSRRPDGPVPASGAELAALVAPAADTMRRVEQRLAEVERDRVGAYAGISAQLQQLGRTSAELGAETRSLAGALRSPTVRGRWGELQLRRVVELAGMAEHCDFEAQVSVPGARPDLLVRLPGDRCVPVDAKVPLDAWLAAREAGDPQESGRLRAAHARALRGHVDALADKAYWRHFRPSPEFVVLFVPGEALLDAALSADPGLWEHAAARRVVLATPTTLIVLLRTIEFGWRQERLSTSAEEILELGRELHDRLDVVLTHISRLGTGLERAVEGYNAAVGSLESRVLVTTRRFGELGVRGERITPPTPIATGLRAVRER
ncbi:DNA recombination protein RmuC [Nakamurella sp. YIM 132087]|uniref:DNA recombination protein RmuC n=1 Tax=Nakamurella alba TaxID=2665158 RepID=A0A7K1FFM0_9ACTN|nr:DNA recombination protein RmuC [Nakamurella alba]MTD12866.1 DNA recombination protein RmuC [Nakamurella alba]